MTRTMYVLQNEDGFFYWKNESTSSSHGLKEGFENAFLFKTRQGAERRRKLPFLSKCEIREVELKLVEDIVNIEEYNIKAVPCIDIKY